MYIILNKINRLFWAPARSTRLTGNTCGVKLRLGVRVELNTRIVRRVVLGFRRARGSVLQELRPTRGFKIEGRPVSRHRQRTPPIAGRASRHDVMTSRSRRALDHHGGSRAAAMWSIHRSRLSIIFYSVALLNGPPPPSPSSSGRGRS